jgi:hypothetical protein
MWFLNLHFLLLTAIQIMCSKHQKPSYAKVWKNTNSLSSAIMDWQRAAFYSDHPPVNQLTPTSNNLPFQTSTIIGGKSNLLLYINFIQHLGNIFSYIFGGHLCRLHNYICVVITIRLA